MDVTEHERISNYTLRLKQIKRKEQLFYRCSTIQSQNTLYIRRLYLNIHRNLFLTLITENKPDITFKNNYNTFILYKIKIYGYGA